MLTGITLEFQDVSLPVDVQPKLQQHDEASQHSLPAKKRSPPRRGSFAHITTGRRTMQLCKCRRSVRATCPRQSLT